MITILAIYESGYQNWAAEGHSRETAEEHYKTAVAFFIAKPLYRVVVTPKYRPIRDAIMDLATRRLPQAIDQEPSETCGRCSGSIARICEFHGCQIPSTMSEES